MALIVTLLIVVCSLVLFGIGVQNKVKLKQPIKIGLMIVGAVGLVLLAPKYGLDHNVIRAPAALKAMIPEKTRTFSGAVSQVAAYEIPATPQGAPDRPVRILSLPWNGMSALSVANGGAQTRSDSIVQKYTKGTVIIERQEDYTVMKQELLKSISGDENAAPFAIIMGDALGAFDASMQDSLKKVNGKIAVVDVLGFSYGEDKCMGPPLNGNPQNAKGKTIAAVPYDGDWNICVKWASDNGIKINPDNSTWDPDALNFADKTTFGEADNAFINQNPNNCEPRKVVRNGTVGKETKPTCLDGVATWTPGDEAVVKQKGGVVSWASTREYNQQMPAVLVANAKWAADHRQFVVNLIKAIDRGAFVVNNGGLDQLGLAQAEINGKGGGNEARPEFWSTYYVGKDMNDGHGNTVRIGGSRVATLAEVRDFLGLTNGSYNVYKGVYEVFGNYAHTFYPKDVPAIPAYDTVVDTSYVREALQGVSVGPVQQQFTEQKSITQEFGGAPVYVEFDTGKATIKGSSVDKLFGIANQTGMTNLRIRISGHTDNTGNSTANVALSRARAQAVADWLYAQAPTTFPRERLEVRGYGDSTPLADNATEAGRAKNRRVEIVLGR